MTLLKRAAVYGATMGVFSIAAVYLVVEYLPPRFGWLVPASGLAIAIAVLWPVARDGRPGFGRQLGRRLLVVASAIPVGALAAFLTVSAAPSYIDWADNQHRSALTRQGKTPAEIEAAVAAHHQEPTHFLMDGALVTAAPGVIGALVSSLAGAVLARRRSDPTAIARSRA